MVGIAHPTRNTTPCGNRSSGEYSPNATGKLARGYLSLDQTDDHRPRTALEGPAAPATDVPRDRRAPSVSIVIPCRNEAGHIAACLRGVLDQEEPDGGIEVIVADGMSDDRTRDVIRECMGRDPRVRLIDNPGRIVSSGLNGGDRPGTRVGHRPNGRPHRVRERLRVAMRGDPGPHRGGQCGRPPGSPGAPTGLSRAIASAFASPFAVGGAPGHDAGHEGPVDTVYLGCWRRAIFDRIGPFDEQLVRNQDDEFNLRLILSGGRIHQSPEIRSWYKPRSSLRSLFRQYLQYGYWKVRVIRKHRRPASPRHLVPVLFVIGAAFGWLAGFAHPAFWAIYAVSMALYALLVLAFSLRSAKASGRDLLPILPVVFATIHVAYGLGFARGIVDFLILRRGPRPSMGTLTRPSARVAPARLS